MTAFNSNDLSVLSGMDLGKLNNDMDKLKSDISKVVSDFEKENKVYVSNISVDRYNVRLDNGLVYQSSLRIGIEVKTNI